MINVNKKNHFWTGYDKNNVTMGADYCYCKPPPKDNVQQWPIVQETWNQRFDNYNNGTLNPGDTTSFRLDLVERIRANQLNAKFSAHQDWYFLQNATNPLQSWCL